MSNTVIFPVVIKFEEQEFFNLNQLTLSQKIAICQTVANSLNVKVGFRWPESSDHVTFSEPER